MQYLPMSELLQDARAGGYAVPSFCVWNAEMMTVVLRTATELRAPVILMMGPFEFTTLSPAVMGEVAHAVARHYAVPAALHLDHGDSPELVQACLDAGFT